MEKIKLKQPNMEYSEDSTEACLYWNIMLFREKDDIKCKKILKNFMLGFEG